MVQQETKDLSIIKEESFDSHEKSLHSDQIEEQINKKQEKRHPDFVFFNS
jgi:hypothetical protein